MKKASDVTNRAIVQYCREHRRVERELLEDWVESKVRQHCGHHAYKGAAWSGLKHMLSTGQVEGVVCKDYIIVKKARLTVPTKKKKPPKQESWGWER